MHPLVARIRRTVRRFSLVPPGARVLVAVSGGADSVALLHALRELERAGEGHVAGIAHLHHGLRGEAADLDEAFCRKLGIDLSLPFESEHADVRAVAAHSRLSLEAAGHRCRHEFLERAAQRLCADLIALGHTRDDQAETFLLRLLRGAGSRGLGGMHPRNGRFIRPMLDCSRRDVRRYVAACSLAYREDLTNDDVSIARNRVRRDVLPALAAMSPNIAAVLSREAAIARDDDEFMEDAAARVSELAVRKGGDRVILDSTVLAMQPRAVARRVVARSLTVLAGDRHVGFEHVERVLDLARAAVAGKEVSLPGQVARALGHQVELVPAGRLDRVDGTSFQFSLSIPGEVVSPRGWSLSADRLASGEAGLSPVTAIDEFPRSWAVVDSSAVRLPLLVRSWRPGDRMRPLGMSGTRKLQDLFVDRKTPRRLRPGVPLVVDSLDRILWVAGHATSEEFRVTPATSDVVILKLKYWRNGT